MAFVREGDISLKLVILEAEADSENFLIIPNTSFSRIGRKDGTLLELKNEIYKAFWFPSGMRHKSWKSNQDHSRIVFVLQEGKAC